MAVNKKRKQADNMARDSAFDVFLQARIEYWHKVFEEHVARYDKDKTYDNQSAINHAWMMVKELELVRRAFNGEPLGEDYRTKGKLI